MNLSDEIQRLHRLHQDGALTDAEFASAKAKLLATDEPQAAGLASDSHSSSPAVEAQLEDIRHQNEIERLDREWSLQRENYLVRGRYGSSIPTQSGSLVGAVVIGGFGIFWTIGAASMGAPAFFPLFGIVFILVGVGGCINSFIKASDYQAAQEQYEQQRAELLDRNNRHSL